MLMNREFGTVSSSRRNKYNNNKCSTNITNMTARSTVIIGLITALLLCAAPCDTYALVTMNRPIKTRTVAFLQPQTTSRRLNQNNDNDGDDGDDDGMGEEKDPLYGELNRWFEDRNQIQPILLTDLLEDDDDDEDEKQPPLISVEDFHWFEPTLRDIEMKYDKLREQLNLSLDQDRLSTPRTVPIEINSVMELILQEEMDDEIKELLHDMRLQRSRKKERKKFVAKKQKEDEEIINNQAQLLDGDGTTTAVVATNDTTVIDQHAKLSRKQALYAAAQALLPGENGEATDMDYLAMDRMEESLLKGSSKEGSNRKQRIEQKLAGMRERMEKQPKNTGDKNAAFKPDDYADWKKYQEIKSYEKSQNIDGTIDEQQVRRKLLDYKEFMARQELTMQAFDEEEKEIAGELENIRQYMPQQQRNFSDVVADINRKALKSLEEVLEKRRSGDGVGTADLEERIGKLRESLEAVNYVDVKFIPKKRKQKVFKDEPVDFSKVFPDQAAKLKGETEPKKKKRSEKGTKKRSKRAQEFADLDLMLDDDDDDDELQQQPRPQLSEEEEDKEFSPSFFDDDYLDDVDEDEPPPPPKTAFFSSLLNADEEVDDDDDDDDDASEYAMSGSDINKPSAERSTSLLGTWEEQQMKNVYRRAGAASDEEKDEVRQSMEEFQRYQDEMMKKYEQMDETDLGYDLADVLTEDGDIDSEKVLSFIKTKPSSTESAEQAPAIVSTDTVDSPEASSTKSADDEQVPAIISTNTVETPEGASSTSIAPSSTKSADDMQAPVTQNSKPVDAYAAAYAAFQQAQAVSAIISTKTVESPESSSSASIAPKSADDEQAPATQNSKPVDAYAAAYAAYQQPAKPAIISTNTIDSPESSSSTSIAPSQEDDSAVVNLAETPTVESKLEDTAPVTDASDTTSIVSPAQEKVKEADEAPRKESERPVPPRFSGKSDINASPEERGTSLLGTYEDQTMKNLYRESGLQDKEEQEKFKEEFQTFQRYQEEAMKSFEEGEGSADDADTSSVATPEDTPVEPTAAAQVLKAEPNQDVPPPLPQPIVTEIVEDFVIQGQRLSEKVELGPRPSAAERKRRLTQGAGWKQPQEVTNEIDPSRGSFLGQQEVGMETTDDEEEPEEEPEEDFEDNKRRIEQALGVKRPEDGIDILDALGRRPGEVKYEDDYKTEEYMFPVRKSGVDLSSYQSRKAMVLERRSLSIMEVNSLMDMKDNLEAEGISPYMARINKPFREFGAIFRLEGVLVDISFLEFRAWKRVAENVNMKPPSRDDVRLASVQTAEYAVSRIFYWTNDYLQCRKIAGMHSRFINEEVKAALDSTVAGEFVGLTEPEEAIVNGKEEESEINGSLPDLDDYQQQQKDLTKSMYIIFAEKYGLRKPTDSELDIAVQLPPASAVEDVFEWSSARNPLGNIVSDLKDIYDSEKRLRNVAKQGVKKYVSAIEETPVSTSEYSNLVIVDGAVSWIKALLDVEMPCGLVSYLDDEVVNLVMKTTGLASLIPPDQRVTSSAGYDRDSFQQLGACLRIDRRPEMCVVFDGNADALNAARDNEMKSVGMTSVYPSYELLAADTTARNFDYLTAMNIRRLFGGRENQEPMLQELLAEPDRPKRKLMTMYPDDDRGGDDQDNEGFENDNYEDDFYFDDGQAYNDADKYSSRRSAPEDGVLYDDDNDDLFQ